MQKLTAMQQKIYDYIANAVRTQGYPPSVRGDRGRPWG